MNSVGMRLNIPNFFGKSLSFEKLILSSHPTILVTKEKPVSMMVTKKTPLYEMTGNVITTEIDLSQYKIPMGLEFLSYILNPKYSHDIFKDYDNDDVLSFNQQFATGSKQSGCHVINVIHHKTPLKQVSSQELFFNIYGNITNNGEYPLVSNFDYSVFSSIEKLIEYDYKKFKSIRDKFPKNYDGVTQLHFSNDQPNLYDEISSAFMDAILYPNWMNVKQEENIFNEFKKTAIQPVISMEDKLQFIKKNQSFFGNEYFKNEILGEDSLLFSTDMNWCGNYPQNSVLCFVNNDESDNLRVHLTGTDDCMTTFIFKKEEFNSRDDFLEFIKKHHNIITYKLTDIMRAKAIDVY